MVAAGLVTGTSHMQGQLVASTSGQDGCRRGAMPLEAGAPFHGAPSGTASQGRHGRFISVPGISPFIACDQ